MFRNKSDIERVSLGVIAGYDYRQWLLDYIYIAFSPKRADSQRYARMLSEGVVQLRRTGRLAVILSKYGLKDWK